MFKKIKKIISKIDLFFYKKFGSEKSLKCLENIKEAEIIFSYLNESKSEMNVRFVGGCVRKALSGENVDDIDLATSLTPQEVKKKLSTKNIKVIDTGIEHGTVTAILNDKKFEITTLRKDISTDGRHANVEFTLNWKDDSARRDFTINAIYADIDGRILDPQNGVSDLQNGIVRFIGSPEKRIKEDYLRILRYFRFFAHYSKHKHDKETILSIKKNINGINKISKERIFNELKKILSLKNIHNLFFQEESKKVILSIFPQFKFYKRLNNFNLLKKELKDLYDYKIILALLIIDSTDNHDFFCYKYKASNKIKDKFKNLSSNFENLNDKNFFLEKNIKRLIYFYGKNNTLDLVLFSILVGGNLEILSVKKLINYVNVCKVPKFPISGEHLKKYGYESGEILGSKLKSLEKKWIENDFSIDEKIILNSLNKNKKN